MGDTKPLELGDDDFDMDLLNSSSADLGDSRPTEDIRVLGASQTVVPAPAAKSDQAAFAGVACFQKIFISLVVR
jgi:hypothetical protein